MVVDGSARTSGSEPQTRLMPGVAPGPSLLGSCIAALLDATTSVAAVRGVRGGGGRGREQNGEEGVHSAQELDKHTASQRGNREAATGKAAGRRQVEVWEFQMGASGHLASLGSASSS